MKENLRDVLIQSRLDLSGEVLADAKNLSMPKVAHGVLLTDLTMRCFKHSGVSGLFDKERIMNLRNPKFRTPKEN